MEQRNPLDLMLTRFQTTTVPLDKEDPSWGAFLDSVRDAGGIREPLDITKDGKVIHGRRRWAAARALKLAEVPCIVRPEAEAAIIFVESKMLREHLSKEAAFYLSIPCLEEFITQANTRSVQNLKKGPVFPNGRNAPSGTIKMLCIRLGLSEDNYKRAVRVWNIFNNPDCRALMDFYRTENLTVPNLERLRKMQAEFKAQLEIEFLRGEKSAWNIIAMVGGAIPELQDRKADNQLQIQFQFWESPFQKLRQAVSVWKKLPEEKRELALEDWRKTVEEMPSDLRDGMVSILEAAS